MNTLIFLFLNLYFFFGDCETRDNVDDASQDELFAGGYLRGHLTLAIAELETENKNNIEALSERVEASIDKAIKAGELSPPDQRLILNTWRMLLENAAR